jgi:hypothetical protein
LRALGSTGSAPRGRSATGTAEPARGAELLQRPSDDRARGYVTFKAGLFTVDGEVTDESTVAFLADFMQEFRDHVKRVLTVLPRS